MKRLLPLAPLPLLLLLTMGVGPCDSKPLGSVDGCTYYGKTYVTGVTFRAVDGCNSCSCQNGSVACTLLGCSDGGIDVSTDGPPATCFDANGKTIVCPISDGGTAVDGGTACTVAGKVYMIGTSFPCSDGCNTCTCTASGVAGTTKACLDSGTSADGGTQCLYDNKAYTVGASFLSSDGCNTCSCTTGGMIACTQKACPDGGTTIDAATDSPITCFTVNGVTVPCAPGGGPAAVCTPGAGQSCNDNPAMNSIIGTCRGDSTCDCGTHQTNPMTGRCTTASVTDCSYNGTSYPVGSKFMCSLTLGCNSGTCYCATPGQTAELCPGEDIPVCGFDAVYTYGQTGGLVTYTDQVTLTPPASYVLTRTVNASASTAAGGACGPALPACNSGPIDVNDIMTAIADPTVQLLISLSMMQPTLVGIDQRPVDGTVFSFKKGGTAGFLVGAPCNGASNCTEIPGAVTSLIGYLQKLDAQQRLDASCQAFLSKM